MQETFTWVYNVIENCNSDFHFQCSDVLISLFRVQYGDNDSANQLRLLWQDRWNRVHPILV